MAYQIFQKLNEEAVLVAARAAERSRNRMRL